jgi:hypothetical protein
MDEDRFNIEIRKFLKEVGVTSQREIERVVREGQAQGGALKLRMTLTAENTPLQHVIERTIEVDDGALSAPRRYFGFLKPSLAERSQPEP